MPLRTQETQDLAGSAAMQAISQTLRTARLTAVFVKGSEESSQISKAAKKRAQKKTRKNTLEVQTFTLLHAL